MILHKLLAPWQLLGRAISTSGKYMPQIVRGNLGLILLFFIPCELAHHLFLAAQKVFEASGQTSLPAQLGDVCVGLLTLVFYTMLMPLRIPEIDKNTALENRKPFWAFTFKHSQAFMLENVRAIAICLFWLVGSALAALALGMILQTFGFFDFQSAIASATAPVGALAVQTEANRTISILLTMLAVGPFTFFYIRYYFVSYVVLCENDYDSGAVNPLKMSSQAAKGLAIPILLVLILYFCMDALRMNMRETFALQTQPLQAVAIAALFELAAIYVNILLFQIYRLKVEGSRSLAKG